MTVNECKKDLCDRLKTLGVSCERMTGRTVSFEGLGYGRCVFIKMHRPVWSDRVKNLGELKQMLRGVIPKPSDGGYCIETDEGGIS